MFKKITAVFFAVLMLLSLTVTAFAAAEPSIVYESVYDAEKGTVTVTVSVKNAVGLQSGDINLAFDESMYEYDSFKSLGADSLSIAAGKAATEDGLCTCSFMSQEQINKDECDKDGTMAMISYVFKPVSDKYDLNDFYLYATSMELNNNNVEVNEQGNALHAKEHEGAVTAGYVSVDKNATASKGGLKWYAYVILAVVVIAAVIGIALLVSKAHQHEEEENSENNVSEEIPQEKETDSSSDKDEPDNE